MSKDRANLERYEYKRQQQIKEFKACFGTDAGKEVLQALREEFYDRSFNPGETLQYEAGQHSVVRTILDMVEQ